MDWLADLILVVHVLFVLFVVGGLAFVWVGAWRGWALARHFWFRVTHLGAILFVASEALLGALCPLTVWEDALRGRETEKGFIARILHAVLYWDAPPWVFTLLYVGFALVVLATFVLIPPARKRKGGTPVP